MLRKMILLTDLLDMKCKIVVGEIEAATYSLLGRT